MPLSPEQQRKVRVHLGVLQISTTGQYIGGLFETREAATILQAAMDSITDAGVTSVVELLAILDRLRTGLSTVDTRFQATQVGKISLNPKEWSDRIEQYEHFRRELAAALDVQEILDGDAGSGIQGPWREP